MPAVQGQNGKGCPIRKGSLGAQPGIEVTRYPLNVLFRIVGKGVDMVHTGDQLNFTLRMGCLVYSFTMVEGNTSIRHPVNHQDGIA